MTPRSVTLTDENMAALFIAVYGSIEGPKRMADTRKFGAAKALAMGERRGRA